MPGVTLRRIQSAASSAGVKRRAFASLPGDSKRSATIAKSSGVNAWPFLGLFVGQPALVGEFTRSVHEDQACGGAAARGHCPQVISLSPGKGGRVVDHTAACLKMGAGFFLGNGVNLRPLRIAQELARQAEPKPVRDLVRIDARGGEWPASVRASTDFPANEILPVKRWRHGRMTYVPSCSAMQLPSLSANSATKP